MCYDGKMGWTAEKLGPNSMYWKRLAQEVKKEPINDVKGRKHIILLR